MYADKLSYAKGVGSSFLTVKESDATSLDDESVISAFSVLSPLYVDWVGNIIMDDGVNRVVLLPACMNPYAFKVLAGDTGQRVNLISLLGMSKWNSNDIDISDNKDDGSKSRFKYKVYVGENSLFTTRGFTSARGKDNALKDYLDEKVFGKGENAQKLRDTIQKYFALSGNANTLYFPKWDKAIDESSKKDTRAYLKDDSMVHANYVLLDNIQEFEWKESEVSKYFKVGDLSKDEKSGTKATFSNIDDFGGIASSIGGSDDVSLSKIYMTYLFAYSNYQKGSTSFKAEENLVDMAFNGDAFPQNADNKIDWGEIESDSNGLMDEIMSMVYYILHPKEGMRYVSVWAKNKISAVLLGWHEDMVGQATSNTSTGMTKYIGFTGYTTIPSLNDLSWTSWMLNNYNSIIVYLIIIISIILCCYVIVGHLTGQRALIGAFMFAVLAFIPPVAINATVNIVNTACDTIYGSKFTYWALVQHQSYLQDLYAATTGGATPEDYRDFVLKSQYAEGTGENAEEQTDNGYASVKLKWMSPKKDNYLASIIEEEQELTGTDSNNVTSNLLGGMLSKQVSGEEFLDEPESLYLYRDYMNITMYALKSYNLYSTFYGGSNGQSNAVDMGTGDYKLQVGAQWQGTNDNKNINYSSGISLQTMVYTNYESDSNYSTAVRNGSDLKKLSSVEAIRNGFMYNTMGADTDLNSKLDYYTKTNLATSYALNYTQVYADLYQSNEALKKDIANGTVEVGKDALRGYGLPQSYFNFTQSDLSKTDATNYSKEKLDYFYYGVYSESPFYFFNYNILDQMNATQDVNYQFQTSKDGGFKNLLLGNNLDYFFNYSENAADGYGELRDFMNMHDLFYYIIPLMDYGDKLVENFDKVYGMKMYDDVKVRFTKDGYVSVSPDEGGSYIISDIIAPDGVEISTDGITGKTLTYHELVKDWTDEQVYKFWHNYNVITIYNAYCTWVDTMYDCEYADKETIHVAGKKFVVTNPLDPTTYFKADDRGNITLGRAMVFSKSEMKYNGLERTDLTEVEKKIMDIQDSVYKKSIDLMNYYTFDDDVLVSAFASLQLFEFNKEFSQTSLLKENFVMYPQGYELKAFTYDAYLRLIISNTTGDNLQAEDNMSLYQRTMENSSITFGIMLIVLDVIAVYIIPAFKLFFLIALFFMSILMIVASAVKIELNIVQVVWKSLISPLLSFAAVSIGLAVVVSLFMYNGAKGVTGETNPTVQLGDPTMVIIVMTVINAVAVYLYFRICRKTGKDFIKYARAIGENIGGTVGGALRKVTGLAFAGKAIDTFRHGSTTSYNARQSGKNNMPRPHIGGTAEDSDRNETGDKSGKSAAYGMGTGLGISMIGKNARLESDTNKSGKHSSDNYNKRVKKASCIL